MGAHSDIEFRARKLRDATAMVSVFGPIIVAFGIIGKFYIDRYRLDEHERRIETLTINLEALRDKVHSVELTLASRQLWNRDRQ